MMHISIIFVIIIIPNVLTTYSIHVKCQPKDTDLSRANSWPPVSRL